MYYYKFKYNKDTYRESLTHTGYVFVSPEMDFVLEDDFIYETKTLLNNSNSININGFNFSSMDFELVDSPSSDVKPEDPTIWSVPRLRTIDFTKDHLKEQIRTRYAMFDRPLNRLNNVVMDSFIPRLLYKYDMDVNWVNESYTFPKTSCCISPWFSQMFGIRQIPISQLIRILGYTERDIKDLLNSVKAKSYYIHFAGYGGTGVNTIYWLSQLAELTHTNDLFKQVIVYESEKAEISNLLRFPVIPTISTYSSNKLDLIGHQLKRLSQLDPFCRSYYLNKYHRASCWNISVSWNEVRNRTYAAKDKHIIYGAPSIESREEFSPIGNFISATHSDSECSLHLNPAQDSSLQVESYGMINLSAFFMNQLRMAIGFLEVLASRDDFQEQNVPLMDYSFDGTRVLTTDRQYNFQLEHNGLVMTEEQAQGDI